MILLNCVYDKVKMTAATATAHSRYTNGNEKKALGNTSIPQSTLDRVRRFQHPFLLSEDRRCDWRTEEVSVLLRSAAQRTGQGDEAKGTEAA